MTKYTIIKSIARIEDGMPISDAMIAYSGSGTFKDCLDTLNRITDERVNEDGAVFMDEYDDTYSSVKQLIRYFLCHNRTKDWVETWSIKPYTA